jgi:NB-ARC domain
MKIEEALAIVDKYSQQRLNHVQELVLCASWQGYSYQECAKIHGYTPEYIKAVGYKLWHILSLAFKEQVTKNNLKSVLRQYAKLIEVPVLEASIKSNQELDGSRSTVIAEAEKSRQSWGEAVDVSVFYGRTEELITLEDWIVQKHCRLVGVFGIIGMGKTALSCKLAQQVQGEFDYIFWRSLLPTQSFNELLTELILFLSNQKENRDDLPNSVEGKISLLINHLRESKCLIVLDNVEAILTSNSYAVDYSQGYEGYGELFRRVGEVQHNSTFVLISQEKPREVDLLEGERLPIRSLRLSGLKPTEIKAIFADKGSFCSLEPDLNFVVEYYAGNPLVLKIVASFIQNLFDGNLADFVKLLKQNKLTLDDINRLLDCQFKRLSDLEQSVMYWLAINQEPVSLQELRDQLFSPREKQKLPEALKSLERRSLIEKTSAKFTQQPVVMQYVTENFIEQICQEITTQRMNLLISHSMIKGSAKPGQKSLILPIIIEQILTFFNSYQSLECQLKKILLKLQEKFPELFGYGAENLINLIRQLQISSADANLSSFSLGQFNLGSRNLEQFKSTQVNLVRSIFTQTFGMNLSEENYPKPKLLKTKSHNSEAYLWQSEQQQLLGCGVSNEAFRASG